MGSILPRLLWNVLSAKPFSSTLEFPEWKWRVLRRRRSFLAPIHNILLSLVWLTIYQELVGTVNVFNTEIGVRFSRSPILTSLPVLFMIIHFIIALWLLFTFGTNLLTGPQGLRLSYWCGMSSLLVLVFLQALDLPSVHENMNELFALFSAVSLNIFHHLGLPQFVTFLVFIVSSIMYIVSLKRDNSPAIFSICVVISVYLLYAYSSFQEVDYKHRFFQAVDNQKSKNNDMYPTNEDLSSALVRLDDSINSFPELDEGLKFLERGYDGLWRWNNKAATLYLQKLLVQALSYSFSDYIPPQNESKFSFNKMCNKLFAMLESTSGCALPLYLDESLSELYITGNQEIFEIMLFLLIYESAQCNRHGYCWITCENDTNNNRSSWTFIVNITILENEKDMDVLKRSTKNNLDSRLSYDNKFDFIPKDIFPNDDAINKSSSWARIARILAVKYLNCTKWEPEIKYKSGFVTLKQIFKIRDEQVSTAQSLESDISSSKLYKQSLLFVNDIDNFANIHKFLDTILVPYKSCAGHELKSLSEQNMHAIAVIHESQLQTFEELRTDIPNIAKSVIVMYDVTNSHSNNNSAFLSLSDTIPAIRMSTNSTAKNFFERIESLLSSRVEPRSLDMDDENQKLKSSVGFLSKKTGNNKFSKSIGGRGREASQSSKVNRDQDHYIQKWLSMLTQFDLEVKNGCVNKGIYDDFIASAIDTCRNRLETMKIESKVEFELMIKAIESVNPTRFPKDFDPYERRAKVLVEQFLSNQEFEKFHTLRKNRDYNAIKELCSINIRRANEFHQRRLACWFSTLRDVCAIMYSHFNSSASVPVKIERNTGSNYSSAVGDELKLQDKPKESEWKDAKASALPFGERINILLENMIDAIEISIWDLIVKE